jgi:1,2-phenylacetyl-CoA epoxidase catalytic subunit
LLSCRIDGKPVFMTDHPEAKLLTILERQGYRELVAAHLFAGGVRMAPSIDEKQMLVQHSAEELAHFELVAALYEQVCGRSLYEVIAARTESFPGAASWPELVVAAYLVDHAAAVQLEAYRAFGDARLDRLVRKILD